MTSLTYEAVLDLFQQTDRKFQEMREESRATDRKFQEMREESRATDRQLRELGRQIGGLGNKFGSFTEGLALPSLEKYLLKQFGMEHISPRHRIRGKDMDREIDVLAWANGKVNQAVLVEVKSHPRAESIEQLQDLLGRFHTLFPEHANKKAVGILAGVDWSAEIRQQALKAGLYVASIKDDLFTMQTPKGFRPKRW